MTLAFDARLSEERSRMDQEASRHKAEFERQFDARTLSRGAGSRRCNSRKPPRNPRIPVADMVERNLKVASAISKADRTGVAPPGSRTGTPDRSPGALEPPHASSRNWRRKNRPSRPDSSSASERICPGPMLAKPDAKQVERRFAPPDEEWERQAESRVRATEMPGSQKRSRRRNCIANRRMISSGRSAGCRQAEFQAQTEEALRRRESDRCQHAQTQAACARKCSSSRASEPCRSSSVDGLALQVNAQAEARRMAAQAKWEAESDIKVSAAVEPFKTLLARTEREREGEAQGKPRPDRPPTRKPWRSN